MRLRVLLKDSINKARHHVKIIPVPLFADHTDSCCKEACGNSNWLVMAVRWRRRRLSRRACAAPQDLYPCLLIPLDLPSCHMLTFTGQNVSSHFALQFSLSVSSPCHVPCPPATQTPPSLARALPLSFSFKVLSRRRSKFSHRRLSLMSVIVRHMRVPRASGAPLL